MTRPQTIAGPKPGTAQDIAAPKPVRRAQIQLRRPLAALAVAALAALQLQAQEPQPSDRPQFRTSVDVFQLDVSVLDKDRQPVRGLTKDDFIVLEDGKPQQIVSFSEVAFPARDRPLYASEEIVSPDVQSARFADRRLFCLVIDDFGMAYRASGGYAGQAIAVPEVKRVAREFLQSLGPMDFAAVQFTKDTRYFPDFTNRYFKLYDAIGNFQPPGEAEVLYLEQLTGGRVGLMPALDDLVNDLARLPQRRKTIVYIGIGNPQSAGDTMVAINGHAREITRRAAREGITISSINVNADQQTAVGPGGPSTYFLRMLADDTGGFAGVGWRRSAQTVAQLFTETQSYYLIGYQRGAAFDGKTHDIDVRVTPKGMHVSARRGYVNPGRNEAYVKADTMPLDEALDAAVKRLDRGDGDDVRSAAAAPPADAGGAWVAAPVVERATMNPRAVFEPAGETTFARSERVRVQWPMLQPADERRVRILRTAGDALTVTPSLTVDDVEGRPTLTTEFPMNFLAPGTYAIELTVGDGRSSQRSLVAFKVTG